jgi:hypothetical protein
VNISRAFLSTEKSAFEGIIAYLTSQHNGNVHERVIVNISALDPYNTDSCHLPRNAADLAATNTYFFSKNESNQMLIYDFQKLRIKSTDYSIRSYHNGGVNTYHLKSWTIEVSSDGSNWKEIDHRENNNDLNGASFIKTFSVSKSIECRFIRLRHIGPNHQGNNHLLLSALEILDIFWSFEAA